jgi:protein required for attachment to host cells
MSNHWIVVADAAHARIFESDELMEKMTEIESRIHPESRLKIGELMSDGRGSTQARPGDARSAMDPQTDRHQVEVEKFAHELAKHLTEGSSRRAFDRLVLVAPPRFLGLLRAELTPELQRKVVAEIRRDWAQRPPHEIPSLVRAAMPEMAG